MRRQKDVALVIAQHMYRINQPNQALDTLSRLRHGQRVCTSEMEHWDEPAWRKPARESSGLPTTQASPVAMDAAARTST